MAALHQTNARLESTNAALDQQARAWRNTEKSVFEMQVQQLKSQLEASQVESKVNACALADMRSAHEKLRQQHTALVVAISRSTPITATPVPAVPMPAPMPALPLSKARYQTHRDICNALDATFGSRGSIGDTDTGTETAPSKSKASLSFPSSLTPLQRKWVHDEAEKRGLVHRSRGGGIQRFVVVTTPTPPLSSWQSSSQPPGKGDSRCRDGKTGSSDSRNGGGNGNGNSDGNGGGNGGSSSARARAYAAELEELRDLGFSSLMADGLLARLIRHKGNVLAVVNEILDLAE
jgi:hypothetical protein